MANNNITNGDLSSLLKIGCVKVLDLSNNQSLIHSSLAEQLKQNTTLKTLLLHRCGITSQSAERLSKALIVNKHVEELDISSNEIRDDGIQHLAHALRDNQGLRKLNLSCTGFTSCSAETLANALAANNNLIELNISYNSLYNNGIQHILLVLRGLKRLTLLASGFTSYSAESLAKSLAANEHLEDLIIGSNALGDNGVQHLEYRISSKSRRGGILFQGSIWCGDNSRAASTEIDTHARTQLQ